MYELFALDFTAYFDMRGSFELGTHSIDYKHFDVMEFVYTHVY